MPLSASTNAPAVVGGAGERPDAMAKEVRFDQLRRHRTAVYDDERVLSARGVIVNRAGRQLLTGPGLPLEEDRHVRRARAFEDREDLSHLEAFSDEAAKARPSAGLDGRPGSVLNAEGRFTELHGHRPRSPQRFDGVGDADAVDE